MFWGSSNHGVTGIIGEVEAGEGGKNDYYLWTHKKLDIGYNGNMVRVGVNDSQSSLSLSLSLSQIVDVNLTSEGKVQLKPGMELPFTYQVGPYLYFSQCSGVLPR